MKKPSDFCVHPYMSVLMKSECETVACNVMKIMSRTGNEWRKVSWEEYREVRIADQEAANKRLNKNIEDKSTHCWSFGENEKYYFDRVIDFCQSAETAKTFSGGWRKIFEDTRA